MKGKSWKNPPVKPVKDERLYRCLVRFDDEFDVTKQIQGQDNAREWVEVISSTGHWFGEDENMTFCPASWVTLAEIEKIA